ncbi:hypothetical protein EW145_g3636 [Phellinidium pouzarii]|uniref:Uncharacterized protein n=1 Tax=Phellinidium pouzarii TaxID=167371 RepID=A0A4S4L8A5_9AGAM|nr:hypothetical protein EW145_g3636 [Phellinidium pouzarii]
MFATLFSATLVFVLSMQGALAEFNINTITLTQCAPAHVTWDASIAPYDLAVVAANDTCGPVLLDLGEHDGVSMTWPNVTFPSGTALVFSLLDANDEEAWSGSMVVGDGDASCLPGATSATSATSAVSSAAAASSVSGTTLVLTSSVAGEHSVAAPEPSESATIVGAANAGILPSGAISSVRLSAGATIMASLMAVVVALAL